MIHKAYPISITHFHCGPALPFEEEFFSEPKEMAKGETIEEAAETVGALGEGANDLLILIAKSDRMLFTRSALEGMKGMVSELQNKGLRVAEMSRKAVKGLTKTIERGTEYTDDAMLMIQEFKPEIIDSTFRGIGKKVIDLDRVNPRKLAGYFDYLKKLGGNIDTFFDDFDMLKMKPGFKNSLDDFAGQLNADKFDLADNVITEWRVYVRGTGHTYDELDWVSTYGDEFGNPVSKPSYAELDGKLSTGDIIEVRNGKNAQSIIENYWGASGQQNTQYIRQSTLLSKYRGREIKLYVRQSVKSGIDDYLMQNDITKHVYIIPGA